MKKIVSFVACLYTCGSMACPEGYFPQSGLHYPVPMMSNLETNSSFSQDHANQAVKKFIEIYSPIVQKEMGKKLIVDLDWESPEVNAFATRDDDNNPMIEVQGGMIRHPLMNTNAMYAILCHEAGHFLGGSPKKPRGQSTLRSWSSAEGQADYYSTARCLREVFKTINAEKAFDPTMLSNHPNYQDAMRICSDDVCLKIAIASVDVAKIYASVKPYGGTLSFTHKDPSEVSFTLYNHPNAQCRLDTLLNGLQCPSADAIHFSNEHPDQGECSRHGHANEVMFSRPLCWYNPSEN